MVEDRRPAPRAWVQYARPGGRQGVIHGSPLESLGFSILGFGIISALAGPALSATLAPFAAYVGLLAGLGGVALVTVGAFTRD